MKNGNAPCMYLYSRQPVGPFKNKPGTGRGPLYFPIGFENPTKNGNAPFMYLYSRQPVGPLKNNDGTLWMADGFLGFLGIQNNLHSGGGSPQTGKEKEEQEGGGKTKLAVGRPHGSKASCHLDGAGRPKPRSRSRARTRG